MKAVVDLVFGPDAPGSGGGEERPGAAATPQLELWTVPAVRWTAALLLHRYSAAAVPGGGAEGAGAEISGGGGEGVGEEVDGGGGGGGGGLGEADVQRWAEQFVASSFGDSLFAAVMVWTLQLRQPEAVQVGSRCRGPTQSFQFRDIWLVQAASPYARIQPLNAVFECDLLSSIVRSSRLPRRRLLHPLALPEKPKK